MSKDLTICSVSYKSEHYLDLNYSIIKKNNSTFKEWIVVDNAKENKLSKEKYNVIQGEDLPSKTGKLVNKHSLHHALGLNKSIEKVNTKYVLFLDPDFYINVNLNNCIRYMMNLGLDFFGSPYFNDGKNRPVKDFPVAFCMFVDCEKINIKDFDFTPELDNDKEWADTGIKIYKKYQPICNYEITMPYGRKYGFDKYWFEGELFGLHCRMKSHLNDRFNKHVDFIKKAFGI